MKPYLILPTDSMIVVQNSWMIGPGMIPYPGSMTVVHRRRHNPAPLNLPTRLVAGPIVGNRAWYLARDGDQPRICSLSSQPLIWQPRRPFVAHCESDFGHGYRHPAPDPTCTCGIYAMIPPHEPAAYYGLYARIPPTAYPDSRFIVRGSVALWGRVIRHERGYRAQYAYPLNLQIVTGPLEAWGPQFTGLEAIRRALATAYRCPVTIE